jgi:hypothetical protein
MPGGRITEAARCSSVIPKVMNSSIEGRRREHA